MDGEGGGPPDQVTRADPDPATNEVSIGTGTGTFNVEAVAVQPGTGVVFAADAGDLGTLDASTGRFTKIGPVGSGAGVLGTVEFEDLDGLSFDAATGLLYGTERRASGEDLPCASIRPVARSCRAASPAMTTTTSPSIRPTARCTLVAPALGGAILWGSTPP